MKKLLVIGGEGYVGNIVVYNFLERGYAVTSLDNLIYKNHICVKNKNHFKNYKFVYGDMLDTKILKPLIKK